MTPQPRKQVVEGLLAEIDNNIRIFAGALNKLFPMRHELAKNAGGRDP